MRGLFRARNNPPDREKPIQRVGAEDVGARGTLEHAENSDGHGAGTRAAGD